MNRSMVPPRASRTGRCGRAGSRARRRCARQEHLVGHPEHELHEAVCKAGDLGLRIRAKGGPTRLVCYPRSVACSSVTPTQAASGIENTCWVRSGRSPSCSQSRRRGKPRPGPVPSPWRRVREGRSHRRRQILRERWLRRSSPRTQPARVVRLRLPRAPGPRCGGAGRRQTRPSAPGACGRRRAWPRARHLHARRRTLDLGITRIPMALKDSARTRAISTSSAGSRWMPASTTSPGRRARRRSMRTRNLGNHRR